MSGWDPDTEPDLEAEPGRIWTSITFILPPGCPLALIHGKWRELPTGEIEASYTPEELKIALGAAGPWEVPGARRPKRRS